MQAVILAGGLGTRLGDLTATMPKVMLPFAGKPFLHHVIWLLKSQDIRDLVICTGYLGEKVRGFFGDGRSDGVNIQYSEEGEKLLGTGGALKKALNLLDSSFLVLNGDTYLLIDYREVAKEYSRAGCKAMVVVYNNKVDTLVKNNIAIDSHKVVVRYDKKGVSSGLDYVDAGVIMLRKETLDYIPEGVPISLEDGIYRPLMERGELAAYVTSQRFYDIGTPEQQSVFEKLVREATK
jgi:NDP-sugar pyrophosphorylase family protein